MKKFRDMQIQPGIGHQNVVLRYNNKVNSYGLLKLD